MILQMIESLASLSSTKQKQELLGSFSNLPVLKRVFTMALDKVTYSYGIRQLPKYTSQATSLSLAQALDMLEGLHKTTGHAGRDLLADTLSKLSANDANVIERIVRRDLKCGVGRTMTNKVWKDLITKPPYMRCAVYSEKTSKHIVFPAVLQEKADGRFLYAIKDGKSITYMSRQGEESDFSQLTEAFLKLQDGVYVGELLVRGVESRSEANGILNSDKAHLANVYVNLWDYLTLDEFSNKISNVSYAKRFQYLISILEGAPEGQLYVIPNIEVRSIQEALVIVGTWMYEGKEGGVLKDYSLPFKDHTSNKQLKLKLEMDIEVKCTGFTEGTPGTSREATFGAMTYSNDEGTIQGQTSGFTDADLTLFNSNRVHYIGKVFTIQFNDLSKSRSSDTYSLMHPRFIMFREDKDITNTLGEAFAIKDMAMCLS